jgi:hypothetical protein
MADKESLTGIAQQTVQITEQTKSAMEHYISWFQNAVSDSPWSNADFNKKLLSHATDNVIAAVELSQAKNLEDVVKIQTEFMGQQEFVQRTATLPIK